MTVDATIDAERILKDIKGIAAEWASQRSERQRRRGLDRADVERLRDAGYHLASLPIEEGGLWESPERSTPPLYELLRTLAHGDSSVALVAAMHPLVLFSGYWLGTP